MNFLVVREDLSFLAGVLLKAPLKYKVLIMIRGVLWIQFVYGGFMYFGTESHELVP